MIVLINFWLKYNPYLVPLSCLSHVLCSLALITHYVQVQTCISNPRISPPLYEPVFDTSQNDNVVWVFDTKPPTPCTCVSLWFVGGSQALITVCDWIINHCSANFCTMLLIFFKILLCWPLVLNLIVRHEVDQWALIMPCLWDDVFPLGCVIISSLM